MQTTYSTIPDPSFQGMLADGGQPHDIASAAYKAGANGSAEFGVAMSFVAGHDGQCQLPSDTDANQKFNGIAVHKFVAPASAAENALTGQQGIVDTQTVDILKKGRIWVPTETAVDPTQAVYYRYAVNGGNNKLGYWSKTSDAGKNQVVASARWLSTTAAAGLAILEINVP